MRDTPEWKGGRIGPYLVGNCYRDIPAEIGRIYEAHNVETGAPALVLLPTENEAWSTRFSWSIRATSYAHPSAHIMEVQNDSEVEDSALHELTLMFIRLAGASASIEDRKAARTHLSHKPTPFPRRRRVVHCGLTGAGLALAAGILLFLRTHALQESQLRHELGSRTRVAMEEPLAFIDARDNSFPVISYPMPIAPFKGQQKPPCIPVTETEIRGGCWVQHAQLPPCPPSTAEYQGKCYMPVKEKTPEPRSVQP